MMNKCGSTQLQPRPSVNLTAVPAGTVQRQRGPHSDKPLATPQRGKAIGRHVAVDPGRDDGIGATVTPILQSPGQSLDPVTRSLMESYFGQDFSGVRVHADAQAAESAQSLDAIAYTVEQDMVFAPGQYNPGTLEGRKILAHELTHTLQQRHNLQHVPQHFTVSPFNDPAEREATAIAQALPQYAAMAEQQPVGERQQGLGVAIAIGAAALVGIGAAIIGGLLSRSIFPRYSEIVADAGVRTAITNAWRNTLAATTPASRREEGFWIRQNKATSRYEFTPTMTGPAVGPADGASVQLGSRPADTNPGTPNAIYTIASFHTHTPTTYRAVGRPVGPSDADGRVDTADDVAGVVYDYAESPAGSGEIPAGHPLNSPAQAYHSGPDRRQRR